jgi:hypothetical protein
LQHLFESSRQTSLCWHFAGIEIPEVAVDQIDSRQCILIGKAAASGIGETRSNASSMAASDSQRRSNLR